MREASSFVRPAKPWKTTRQARAEVKEAEVVKPTRPTKRKAPRVKTATQAEEPDVTRDIINSAKREVRRPLKPRDIEFIKAKVDGKPNYEAAMIATGATSEKVGSVQAVRMLENVSLREALNEALYKAGLTIDNVAEVLTDATQATKTVQVGAELVVTEVPDHSIRLNAVKAIGTIFADRSGNGDGGSTINFNIGTQNFVKKVEVKP